MLVFCQYPIKWLIQGQSVIVWHTPSDLEWKNWLYNPHITPLIKRIKGLPGDIIELESKRIRGSFKKSLRLVNEDTFSFHVPNNYIFIECENKFEGLDSYSWGPISTKGILGIVLFKFHNHV